MTKAIKNSDAIDAALTRLFAEGATNERIADELGISKSRIDARAKKLGIKRAYRDPDEVAADERKRISDKHYDDLKRAGHTPEKTELAIRTDARKPTRYVHAPLTISCIGSPMARCAEIDGPGGW